MVNYESQRFCYLIFSNKIFKCDIAKPLAFIINQTLRTGSYHDKLEIARVRPLYKKLDKQVIENYRPKFGKNIHTQLVSYFDQV